jgi:hypothetical protein
MSTPPQTPSANDFLMGGGGAPSAAFPAPGTLVGGTITETPVVQQQRDLKDGSPKFWSDGNPQMQMVVTIQTEQRDPGNPDDDGKRRLFVKGQMKQAVADAVRAAGAPGLQVGGVLEVAYTHDGPVAQRGFNAPKQYKARYTAASAGDVFLSSNGASAASVPDPWAATAAPATPAPTPAQQALLQQQAASAANAAPAVEPPPF